MCRVQECARFSVEFAVFNRSRKARAAFLDGAIIRLKRSDCSQLEKRSVMKNFSLSVREGAIFVPGGQVGAEGAQPRQFNWRLEDAEQSAALTFSVTAPVAGALNRRGKKFFNCLHGDPIESPKPVQFGPSKCPERRKSPLFAPVCARGCCCVTLSGRKFGNETLPTQMKR